MSPAPATGPGADDGEERFEKDAVGLHPGLDADEMNVEAARRAANHSARDSDTGVEEGALVARCEL